eukprot:13720965-Ditylum_brightwellii.AAC.1
MDERSELQSISAGIEPGTEYVNTIELSCEDVSLLVLVKVDCPEPVKLSLIGHYQSIYNWGKEELGIMVGHLMLQHVLSQPSCYYYCTKAARSRPMLSDGITRGLYGILQNWETWYKITSLTTGAVQRLYGVLFSLIIVAILNAVAMAAVH